MSDIYIHEYKGDTRKLIFEGLVKETENESEKSLTISLFNDSSSKVSGKNYNWSISSNKGTVARLNWSNNTLVEESEEDSYYIKFDNSYSSGSTTTSRSMLMYVGPENCGLDFKMSTPLGQVRAQLSATRLAMSDPSINSSYLSSTALTMYASNQLCAEFSATGTTIPFIAIGDTDDFETLPKFWEVVAGPDSSNQGKLQQANVIIVRLVMPEYSGARLYAYSYSSDTGNYTKTNRYWGLTGGKTYMLVPTVKSLVGNNGWVPLLLSDSAFPNPTGEDT